MKTNPVAVASVKHFCKVKVKKQTLLLRLQQSTSAKSLKIPFLLRLYWRRLPKNLIWKQLASKSTKMLQTYNIHASKSVQCCVNFKVSWVLHQITSLRLHASTSTKPSATVSAEAFIDCWLDAPRAIVNFKFYTNAAYADTINTTHLHMFLMFASWSTAAFNKRTSNYYYIN